MEEKLDLEKMFKPENDLEKALIRNEEFIVGSNWGKPRKGHDEGKVAYHIVDVLANVDKFSNDGNRSDLRLITLIHDTFKYKVDETKNRDGENHHAMIARRFAERFGITDPVLLDIIELHDEGYNAYCVGARNSTKWEKAKGRAIKLINRLDKLDVNALDLYLTFFRCDNSTDSKEPDSFEWFEELVLNS